MPEVVVVLLPEAAVEPVPAVVPVVVPVVVPAVVPVVAPLAVLLEEAALLPVVVDAVDLLSAAELLEEDLLLGVVVCVLWVVVFEAAVVFLLDLPQADKEQTIAATTQTIPIFLVTFPSFMGTIPFQLYLPDSAGLRPAP